MLASGDRAQILSLLKLDVVVKVFMCNIKRTPLKPIILPVLHAKRPHLLFKCFAILPLVILPLLLQYYYYYCWCCYYYCYSYYITSFTTTTDLVQECM